MNMKVYSFLLLVYYMWNHVSAGKIRNFGIYGGTPVSITQVPFMAMVRPVNVTWWCGAAIVTQQFLVTAAHCSTPNLRVTVGTDNAINGGTEYYIQNMFIHPNYNNIPHDYDIAVIKLTNKLQWSDRVQPIQMSNSVPRDGDIVETFGFGSTKENLESFSEVLLGVRLAVINPNTCVERLKPNDITSRMICAAGANGANSCHGDSGGPLRFQGKLVGVVSWGLAQQGCTSRYPAVYSNLPVLRKFIDDVIRNNS